MLSGKVRKLRPRLFGHSKLLVTRKKGIIEYRSERLVLSVDHVNKYTVFYTCICAFGQLLALETEF